MTDMVERARQLAIWAHEPQMYNLHSGNVPYIRHIENVVARGKAGNPDETLEIVAWLHDVVEDTSITLEVIRTEFSATVEEAVDALTRKESERGSENTYMDYIRRLKPNSIARFVKINDLQENMSHCTQPEHKTLLERYRRALDYLLET